MLNAKQMSMLTTKENMYFKKLDSLRFFAFFLVFWQHIISSKFTVFNENDILGTLIKNSLYTGGTGVHLFFVISGFLITFLMISEEKLNGRFNIKYFYIRRILRIWPLYYLILILGIFILPSLFKTFKFNGSIFKNLLFLNNFDMVDQQPNIGIAWSVAIEEQFYLFWPLLFIFFKRKNTLLIISSGLFLLSIIFTIKNPS